MTQESYNGRMLRASWLNVVLPLLSGFVLVVLYAAILLPVHSWLPAVPAEVILYGSLPEEVLKLCLVLWLIRRGMMPLSAALAGIGFGLGEALWFATLYPWTTIDILGPLSHGLSDLAMGAFLTLAYRPAKTHRAFWLYVLLALLSAIAVHSAYNVLALVIPPLLH